jgi:PAP2 superfamily
MRSTRIKRARIAAVLAAIVSTVAFPAAARADAVTDWFIVGRSAILAGNPPPNGSMIYFGMLQGAVYDAVNAVDGGYQPYLLRPEDDPAGQLDSIDAAAATAAFRVLSVIAPGQISQEYYDAYIAALPGTQTAIDNGTAAGEAAAAAMLTARANDGRENAGLPFPNTDPYLIGYLPGQWRPSPNSVTTPAPDPSWWVGSVKTFLLPDASTVRTEGPKALTSDAYAQEFNEVKSLGAFDSTTRSPDQTKAAIFWNDRPMVLWGDLGLRLADRIGLETADRARLLGMVGLATADAAIGCWTDKYYWRFWRPVDAIRLADTDGNAATEADPTWLPLFDTAKLAALPGEPFDATARAGLQTPPYPDHPSGHNCLGGAAVTTMQDFFGTKVEGGIVVTSARFPGYTRTFDRFSDVLNEITWARVWAGIHFRSADRQAVALGRTVAHYERNHYFAPLR